MTTSHGSWIWDVKSIVSYPNFWPKMSLTRVVGLWFSVKISAERYFKIPHFLVPSRALFSQFLFFFSFHLLFLFNSFLFSFFLLIFIFYYFLFLCPNVILLFCPNNPTQAVIHIFFTLGGQGSHPWWPRLTPLVAKLLFINTPAVRTTKERPKSIAAYKTTQSTCKNNQRNTANTLTTQNRSIFQANHNITTQNNLNHNTTDSNTTRPINTQTQPNHSNITIPEPKPKRKPSKYISESLNSRSKAVVYFFRKFEVENGISRLKHIGKNKKKIKKKNIWGGGGTV